MDPFASPSSDGLHHVGTLSTATAVSDAVSGLLQNALLWIAVMFTYMALIVVGVCTVFGWIVIMPLLVWGLQAVALEAVDGPARFNTLFGGWHDLGTTLARIWGLLLLGGVAYAALAGPLLVLLLFPDIQQAMDGAPFDQTSLTLKMACVGFILSFVHARFVLVMPLIVERGRPVLASITESWQQTSGHWPKLIGLMLLGQLLNLPPLVLNVGAAMLSDPALPPDEALRNLPLLGTQLGGATLSMFASVFMMMLFAAVFRQLMGPAPQRAG